MRRGGGAHANSGKSKKEYLKRKRVEREARKHLELAECEAESMAALALSERPADKGKDKDIGEDDDDESTSASASGSSSAAAAASSAAAMRPLGWAEGEQELARSGKDNKLTSLFAREDDAAVQARRADASRALDTARRGRALVAPLMADLGLPTRPAWDARTSPEALDVMERAMFARWRDSVQARFAPQHVSPFERNLEVWRQLWRTLEKSSAVVVTADARNPLLHLPAALFAHLQGLGLPALVVLTKVDLVSRAHVERWLRFLPRLLPADVRLATFSTKLVGTEGAHCDVKGGAAMRRKALAGKVKGEEAHAHAQAGQLLGLCIRVAREAPSRGGGQGEAPCIGIVGQPNTGKSSLLNALVGQKVVSVSRSCGHTKHWQTHVVSGPDGAPVATLVDSPGLIFATAFQDAEAAAPRQVFELSGLYPIPQIRETYSALRFLAEHVPLELLYGLELNEEDYGPCWSPYAIAGAFADKKGYTIEGGGPDLHRAGLEIIRDVVDGYVLLAFDPPDHE